VKKFPLLDRVPPEFDGLLLDFWWDMDKLHKLNLPRTKASTADLKWQLDLPWWQYNGQYFVLSPNQVAANSDKYTEQYQRTLAADLNHPIIARRVNNRWVILDGVHRRSKLISKRCLKSK
jgi:hypothetical protein